MKLIKEKKIYTGNGVIENGYIRFDEKIEEVGDMAGFEPKEGDLEVSCAGTMVVPGFIDIHSHGGYGKDNMDATPDEIDEMVKQMTKKEGITTYFCTTMTQTYENIEKAMQNIHDAAQKNPVIKGIHVEGPFISTVFMGHKILLILRSRMKKHWQNGMRSAAVSCVLLLMRRKRQIHHLRHGARKMELS